MSEYQYYEFQAIDRRLTEDQMRQLRDMSTRVTITPTSFVNVYHWGDLKGDPKRLVERMFDAHLYTAGWGSRQVMLKVPKRQLSLKVAEQYCDTDVASAWSHGSSVVLDLSIHPEDGADEYWNEDDQEEGILGSIVAARTDLARGDLRLLYIAWLFSADVGELEDDELEPPVPPGLGELPGSLESLISFLRIDPYLVAAAAEGSEEAPDAPGDEELADWVANLPAKTKDKMLVRLMRMEDQFLGQTLMRQFQEARKADAPAGPASRTVGDLLFRAAQLRGEGERAAAEASRRAEEERQRKAAVARGKRLDALKKQGERPWKQVDELIATSKPRQYDEAVALLVDLRDLGVREGAEAAVTERLDALGARYANRTALLRRFDAAGLG
ncbi:hypothetical protein [Kineosporia babensis]|uniref:Uncharacterized protein n=1 Tax=Kineosporia babensis TaxID=499548 RepID=A0A9X1NFM0_9ACTN|nr:hypothetical protein [Kineosporia babensis]MCD5313004.1 hypothetical protein [Kineosporia babensis]